MTTPGLDLVLELLARIAAGERGARAEGTGEDETIDALLEGLSMLSEELDSEREARQSAEAMLADERDAYQRSPGLLCSIDAQSLRVLKCNDTLAQVVGVPREDLAGRPVMSLFRESQRANLEQLVRAAALGEVVAIPELLLLGSNGERRVTTTLSFTDVPSPRLRIVWFDVTNERRLEAQLVQAQKMQAVGRLSGGVAHDFNNILGVILSAASFLQDQGADSATFEQDLDSILLSARRGADLTAQLLAFSRQQVAQPKRVEIGGLIREVDAMLRRLISESISISVEIADDSFFVVADPAQLIQVFLNLAVNARDALRGHGRILFEAERVVLDRAYSATHLEVAPGSYAMVSVSDDGAGMTPEVLAQAFEPFFTTKPAGEGTGLGLSVCYGIVRQAGGHISLSSQPGKGTTVKVYLPLAQAAASPSQKPDEAARVRRGDEQILLVEDDPFLRKLTARLLERAGYRIVVAENGRQALDLMAGRGSVDLVVTDVVMPKLGGRDLVDQLKRENKMRAALYLSGYTANSIGNDGVLEEGVHFLGKPFTVDQLLRAVRRALGEE